MTLAATATETPVFLESNVVWLQRLEGAVMLAGSIAAYAWLGQSWLLFAVLLLAPDLVMLGYLHSLRAGTLSYNLVHNYVGPALLTLAGLALGPWAFGLAAIWTAHIGMDRLLGYGLKLSTGFGDTHLGRKGKAR